MNGTILAVLLVLLALPYALKALDAVKQRLEAEPTHQRRREPFVTHAELDERLSAELKKIDWANEEWHEKFATLHARMSKREKRAKQPELELGATEDDVEQPSVLQFRRLGSV